MRFAMSNIAWPLEFDASMAGILRDNGFSGIEVAPTKMWPSPLEASDAQIAQYRKFWLDNGIEIVAAQALLFGHPELTIFDSPAVMAKTIDYIGGICRICGLLGADALVFGSPKNRIVPQGMEQRQAWDIAADFFTAIANQAKSHNTTIVIEANPAVYGGNFITGSQDAIRLVEMVDNSGLRLHLDTACMTMAGDDTAVMIEKGKKHLHHFHISEPYLEPIFSSGTVNHSDIAASLSKIGYNRWHSVEMKQPKDFSPDKISGMIAKVRSVYGRL